MIKEINNPLISIFEIAEHKNLIRRLKKRTKSALGIYDVAFNTDYSLVEELSKKYNIDEDKALSFLIVFFEEIKKEMMDGGIVKLVGLGKFYINGPHRDKNCNLVMPSEKSPLYPKFKLSVQMKRKLKSL